MGVYNFIYVITLIGLLFSFLKMKQMTNIFFLVCATLITLSVALRDGDMGNDTRNYLAYFLHPDNQSEYYYDVKYKEPLYTLFNYVVGFFTSNKYIFLFLTALIPYTLLFYIGKKQASNLMLFVWFVLSFSIGASFFILSFSMVRQTMALGVWCVLLNHYIENERRIDKFLIIGIVIMALFHNASLIVILPLALDRIVLSKKVMYIACIFAYFAGLLFRYTMPYITQLAIMTNKEFYLTKNMEEFLWNPLQLLPYLGLLLVILFYNTKEQCNNICVKSFLISVIICGILGNMGTNLDRINMFFYIPIFLAVSSLFTQLQREKRFIFFPLLIVFMVYFTYKYYVIFKGVYEAAPLVPWHSSLS